MTRNGAGRLVLSDYLFCKGAPGRVSCPIQGVDTAHDTDQRLMDLEIKASFLEDLVESLNQVVIRQQQQIDLLVREVKALRDQVPEPGQAPFRSLRDELPPHY